MHDHTYWMYQPVKQTRTSVPGEHHWTLRKDADRADCEFRTTIDAGCELQLFKNGEIVTGQLFKTRAMAEQWADHQRERLIRQGWHALNVL